MKKILYFCGMLAVTIALAACQKNNEPNNPNEEGNNPEPEKTRLEAPQIQIIESTISSITVSWTEVENADYYEVRLGENGAAENMGKDLEATVDGLYPMTSYVIFVRAAANRDSDYITSNWNSCEGYITPETVNPSLELEPWLGEYTVTSSGTLEMTAPNNMIKYNFVKDKSMKFDISIQNSWYGQALFIYGFSAAYGLKNTPDTFQAYGSLLTMVNNETQESEVLGFGIVTGETTFIQTNDDGSTAAWYPICLVDRPLEGDQTINDNIQFIADVSYLGYWTEKDGAYEYTQNTNTAQNQLGEKFPFEVLSTDVFAMYPDGQVGVYYDFTQQSQFDLPAGKFTLVRKSDAETTPEEQAINRARVRNTLKPVVYAAERYDLSVR